MILPNDVEIDSAETPTSSATAIQREACSTERPVAAAMSVACLAMSSNAPTALIPNPISAAPAPAARTPALALIVSNADEAPALNLFVVPSASDDGLS